MEESMKKPVLLGVIVVCLVLAGVITFKVRSGKTGIPEHFEKEMIWVKCRNPDCEATYQTTKKDYYEYIEAHVDPRMMEPPPLVCEKCKEESGYRAVKCEKCELVFEIGSVPADFEDRCPECKYSTIEKKRKEAAARRRGG